jgi:hypothetical protein
MLDGVREPRGVAMRAVVLWGGRLEVRGTDDPSRVIIGRHPQAQGCFAELHPNG